MKDDRLTIHIKINNREYRLNIPRQEEEEQRYREAAELIKNKIRDYRNAFHDADTDEILEMVAFDIAYKYISMKPYKDKVEQWENTLDECLKEAE